MIPFLYIVLVKILQLESFMKTSFSEKEYLSVTLKSIGDGVIVTDQEGKITLMNSVAENLLVGITMKHWTAN